MPSASAAILMFLGWWPVWLPAILALIFWDVWVRYVRTYFLAKTKFMLLEIKIPRDIAKSPKAMESVFASIGGSRRIGNMWERYWDGWLYAWFSFEIVGDETGVHFYIWGPVFFKRLLESQIYAQYPSIEINEVAEDYTKNVSRKIPDEHWNLWGSEFQLSKPDAYPILTYEDFPLADISPKEEERKVDPLASLVEHLGSLREGEKFWLQIMIRAADDSWKKEGEKLVAKLIGREVKTKRSLLRHIVDILDNIFIIVFGLEKPEPKKQEGMPGIMLLSPGEQDVVKAIERNIAQIGFEVGIRWIYLAKRDVYNLLAVPAINGIFKQFASQSLNGFKLNGKVTTSIDYVFKKTRLGMRQRRLLNAYRMRSYFYPPYNKYKPFVFSAAELATIYHFPGTVVGTPAMERIGAKKGAAPPNLPI